MASVYGQFALSFLPPHAAHGNLDSVAQHDRRRLRRTRGSQPVAAIPEGGNAEVVTLFTRSGQVTTNDNPTFNVNNVNEPFWQAQQGVTGSPQ